MLITAALAVGGAVVGAVVGMAVALLIGLVAVGSDVLAFGRAFAFAALIGAACGFVLAPVGYMALLRHVPLWRVFVETAAGTVVAGVLGLWTLGFRAGLALAAAGFFAAAVRLSRAYPRPSAGTPHPPAG